MLVIALETSAGSDEELSWSGRRHDDEYPERTAGKSAQDLFDTVFLALHDGEQVALGVDAPLTAPFSDGATDEATLLQVADSAPPSPGVEKLGQLLGQLGIWRPWTAVTTSPKHWLATRSILVWEAPPAAPADTAVQTFFDLLPNRGATGTASAPVVNLAVACAVRAGLAVERAELTQPALTLPTA